MPSQMQDYAIVVSSGRWHHEHRFRTSSLEAAVTRAGNILADYHRDPTGSPLARVALPLNGTATITIARIDAQPN